MSKAQLQAMLESAQVAYKANGGKVTTLAEGERSEAGKAITSGLNRCRCGCDGDYTLHTMRAGESGRCSSVIIR